MQYTLDIAICPDSHYIWSKSCRGCGSLLCTLPERPEYRSHCPAQCQALKAREAQEREELLNQNTRCLLCGIQVTNRERQQHLALCELTHPATRQRWPKSRIVQTKKPTPWPTPSASAGNA